MEKLIGFDVHSPWDMKGGVCIAHILEKDDGSACDVDIDDSYANTVILACPSVVTADEAPDCLLNLVSSSAGVCLAGLSVISEARYAEIHSHKQGYLGTGKGSSIRSKSGEELFVKDVTFENPVSECSIKFLKFDNPNQMKIFKIRARTRNMSPSASVGSINYDKVQELLDEMGQTIPDEAKSMLQSVRNYQQSHVGASSMMASPGSGGQAAGMTGLLAMMSQMSTTGATGSVNPASSHGPQITEGDLMNVMRGMMGGQSTDTPVMLDSLRNICGAVSKQREQERTMTAVVPPGDELGKEMSPEPTSDTVLKEVDQKISDMEEKIMTNVDEKLQGVESRIMNKLDMLLNVLAVDKQGKDSSGND